MFLSIVLCAAAALVALAYYFATSKFNYWKKRNVPHVKPTPLLGNYGEFIRAKKYMGELVQDLCKQFPDKPYFGAFYGTEPTLIVQDPEYVKLVTTKDFYYFNGREISPYHDREIFGKNVFSADGDEWKVVRQNLTPVFTSSKMKNMFPLIEACSRDFEKLLDEESKISNEFEMRSEMARFTMACIASCAFGVDSKTMGKGFEENPFTLAGNAIFQRSLKFFLRSQWRAIWPAIFYGFKQAIVLQQVTDFFHNFLVSVFQARQYKPTARNDFVDFILNFKNKNNIVGDSLSNVKTGESKKVTYPVTDEFLVANCTVFFLAGFETSATTLSFTMYELAKSPENQRRVQKEVDEYLAKTGNQLLYNCVSELPFTEACVDETLRLYPVLGVITREVMEDYTLPDGVKLDKGVRVHLPVHHLHHNPKFFPEPEVFQPQRFYGEEKHKIIPHTYIPFGDGPRLCLGMRFARMQVMAGLVTVLKKYNLELAEGTPSKVEFLPLSVIPQPTEYIKLKFIPREGWENRTFVETTAL